MSSSPSDRVIIVVGPTASGKSALAESLAIALGGEIINADVGQFYAPLSIGTAKPDLANVPVPHHLFDICDDPVDVNVVQYRDRVLQKIKEIKSRNKVPFLVGGSLFYIKSLFFPPQDFPKNTKHEADGGSDFAQGGWHALNEIDPVRAAHLHPNDLYRIQRALEIWRTTGVLPSQARPNVEKPFEPLFIWIDVDNQTIKDRISRRTIEMLKAGWVQETQEVLNKDVRWDQFFDHKGLIGYREIADWIARGEKEDELDAVATKIINLTYWYAKRQKTFWRSFREQLIEFEVIKESQLLNCDTNSPAVVLEQVKNFLT